MDSSSANQSQFPWSIFISQSILLATMISIFWIPKDEDYFPLSKFPMFATHRPKLEPLAYVEVIFSDGNHKNVPVQYWNQAGSSNARTQLQTIPEKSIIDRHRFCVELTEKLSDWFGKQSEIATELRIVGGRFKRTDVLSQLPIQPVNSVIIHSCPIMSSSQ